MQRTFFVSHSTTKHTRAHGCASGSLHEKMGLTRVGLTFVDPITGAHSDHAPKRRDDSGGGAGDGDEEKLSTMRRRLEECEQMASTSTIARDAHAAKRDAATAKAAKLERDIAVMAEKLEKDRKEAEEGLRDPKAELDKVLESVKKIGKKQMDEMKNLRNPSPSIKAVLTSVHLILNGKSKYPTRRMAGKGKEDWEAIRATFVANDFVPRMTCFDPDQDFSTGCEHVAELILEELIDPDGDDNGGGGNLGRGSGERKPIVASVSTGNTKAAKLNPKLLAKSPFGGGGAAAAAKKQPGAKAAATTTAAAKNSPRGGGGGTSRPSSTGSSPGMSPRKASTAAAAQQPQPQPQPRTSTGGGGAAGGGGFGKSKWRAAITKVVDGNNAALGIPPRTSAVAGGGGGGQPPLSSKWTAALTAVLPSKHQRFTISEVAYANKTAADLFRWVVVQLQKHKFAVLSATLQGGGELHKSHTTATTERAEAEVTAVTEAAAETAAAATAVAKSAEAADLRAKIASMTTDRLAMETRKRIGAGFAAAGEDERRAKEEEKISRISRRLTLMPPFRDDILRTARVRFSAGITRVDGGASVDGDDDDENNNTDDNIAALKAAARVMRDFPTLMVNVTGTPGFGDPMDFSTNLPLARADACVAWLVEKGGVDKIRLRSSVAEMGYREEAGTLRTIPHRAGHGPQLICSVSSLSSPPITVSQHRCLTVKNKSTLVPRLRRLKPSECVQRVQRKCRQDHGKRSWMQATAATTTTTTTSGRLFASTESGN